MNTSHRVACGAVSWCWKVCNSVPLSPEGFDVARHSESVVALCSRIVISTEKPCKFREMTHRLSLGCAAWKCEWPGMDIGHVNMCKGKSIDKLLLFLLWLCVCEQLLAFISSKCPIWQMTEWNGPSSPIQRLEPDKSTAQTRVRGALLSSVAAHIWEEVSLARGKRSRGHMQYFVMRIWLAFYQRMSLLIAHRRMAKWFYYFIFSAIRINVKYV